MTLKRRSDATTTGRRHVTWPSRLSAETRQEEQNHLLILGTAAAVQGKLFATKEGLSGMRGAARFAEDTAVLKLGVREHGGLKE